MRTRVIQVNAVTKYQPVANLYPLQRNESTRAIIQATLAWGQTIEGKSMLMRELSVAERTLLQDRSHELGEHLKHAKKSDIIARVSQMIIGFGAAAANVSDKDAKTMAAQYAFVLQSLPFWAIERACGKFERGEVTIDQIEGVNRAFWPTTAQLHAIAEKICGEFYAEQRQVHDCLLGQIEHVPSPEERARVKAGLDDLAISLRSMVDDEKEAEKGHRKPWVGQTNDDLRQKYPVRSSVNDSQVPAEPS